MKVIPVSAHTNTGIDKSWSQMLAFKTAMIDSGKFIGKRSYQLRKWMWNNVKDRILDQFLTNEEIQMAIKSYEKQVTRGLMTPFVAADEILGLLTKEKTDKNAKI